MSRPVYVTTRPVTMRRTSCFFRASWPIDFVRGFSTILLMSKLLVLLSGLCAVPVLAERFPAVPAQSFEVWVDTQPPRLIDAILDHVSPGDALAGAVIASPERGEPDYYFHWVRDAALTMITIGEAGPHGRLGEAHVERLFKNYAALSRIHQASAPHPGMAKFHVDSGRPYLGPWCQPQNDGPALRALALTGFALTHLGRSDGHYVRTQLYDGKLPTDTVVKRDLEFVAHHWREPSCDLWEETWGDHFYTRMVQRKALVEGARLADRLGDSAAAKFYRGEARAIASELEKHWDPNVGLIRATLNRGEGIAKEHDLDSAVVLGLLHGHTADGVFDLDDPRVLASVEKMAQVFKDLYPINRAGPGIGVGRYKEDTWNKVRGAYGNPWYLLTAAFAQVYFRAAAGASDSARAAELYQTGESFLRRIHHHAHEGGYRILDEQFDRFDGHMSSAPDLTWSYAEVLEATWAREDARRRLTRGARSCRTDLGQSELATEREPAD